MAGGPLKGRVPKRVAEYGNGWVGFNLAPDEAAAKIKKIEELLKANGRKLSDVEIAASPYTKQITKDDLKRYRDAGVQELVMVNLRPPRAEDELVKDLEKIAHDWIEPASKPATPSTARDRTIRTRKPIMNRPESPRGRTAAAQRPSMTYASSPLAPVLRISGPASRRPC